MPAAYPPSLRSLSDPRPHPNPAKVPASTRYASGRTLQDDLDDLDADEDAHYTQVYDLRQYGHAWLVPLGRQRTHDEDADSMLNSSPNAGAHEPDGSFSPPPNIGAGAGDALPRPVPLNLDEPAAAARRHGARLPTGGRRAFEPEDSDADEEEAAVDLDAEIEDADATRGSSADEDSVGARRGGADDSGEASMDM
ncbi:hypothetical protein JCM8202_006090 [Rhodotorula sphaerocarpa]